MSKRKQNNKLQSSGSSKLRKKGSVVLYDSELEDNVSTSDRDKSSSSAARDILTEGIEASSSTSSSSSSSSSTVLTLRHNKYNFKYLPSLNLSEVSKGNLENDFLNATGSILKETMDFDKKLDDFFMEVCIFAYNSDIVGEEQLRHILSDIWKV